MLDTVCDIPYVSFLNFFFVFFGHDQTLKQVIVMLFDSDSPLISGQSVSFSAQ